MRDLIDLTDLEIKAYKKLLESDLFSKNELDIFQDHCKTLENKLSKKVYLCRSDTAKMTGWYSGTLKRWDEKHKVKSMFYNNKNYYTVKQIIELKEMKNDKSKD